MKELFDYEYEQRKNRTKVNEEEMFEIPPNPNGKMYKKNKKAQEKYDEYIKLRDKEFAEKD